LESEIEIALMSIRFKIHDQQRNISFSNNEKYSLNINQPISAIHAAGQTMKSP